MTQGHRRLLGDVRRHWRHRMTQVDIRRHKRHKRHRTYRRHWGHRRHRRHMRHRRCLEFYC